MIDLLKIQNEIEKWQRKNFDDYTHVDIFFGIVEEVGELSRALLKSKFKIKGFNNQNFHEFQRDSIADLLIFILGYCQYFGIDSEKIISKTWAMVKKRNFKKYPVDGISK